MQSAIVRRPPDVIAAPSLPKNASAPAGQANKLFCLDDELELTERDLWEDEADLSQDDEAVLTSTSAPNLGLGHSSDSEADLEPPSPDIKAFHGDTKSHQHDPDSNSADPTIDEDTGPEHSARGSMEKHSRLSTDSASAMPTGQRQHRRPPLRANSTYASRIGMHPRATIKMGSSAPINIPTMSRLPSIRDDDAEDAAKIPLVPPHLLDQTKKGNSLQQFCMIAGVSTGASVRSRKLQQRDAILRRTGFIEAPACIKGVGDVLEPIKESHVEFFHSRSKLTEALGTSPQVGSSS